MMGVLGSGCVVPCVTRHGAQALEALEDAEDCDSYMFVEQHTEWEMEKKRLGREAERHTRQARVSALLLA